MPTQRRSEKLSPEDLLNNEQRESTQKYLMRTLYADPDKRKDFSYQDIYRNEFELKCYPQPFLSKDFKSFALPKIAKPKISFVMPVFNRAHLVAETIESILRQIVKEWELIIVDDGSTDSIEDIIEFYTADERIGYISLKENTGVATARNVGNRHTRSGYIAVADSDDLYLPKRAELSIEGLKKYSIFYGSYFEADLRGRPVVLHKAEKINIKKFIRKHYTAGGSILSYRKEVAMKIPYQWGVRYNDDYQFLVDCIGEGYTIGYTAEPLGKVRAQYEGISMSEARKSD